jgi:hypothetical protein
MRAEMQAARRELDLLTRSLVEIAGEVPPEALARAREAGAAFQKRVDDWREAHAEEFRSIEERLRAASEPDADALRAAARLRDSMPRVKELRDAIDALLDDRARESLGKRIQMNLQESEPGSTAERGQGPSRPAGRALPPADSPTRKGDGKPSGR